MRKIIVLEHISIDGVIQAPGGPDEDTSSGFANGGWAAPYSDEILGTLLRKQMNLPFDLLLGRKTFEIWASFWLMIYPITLGRGKRLFADGTIPAAFAPLTQEKPGKDSSQLGSSSNKAFPTQSEHSTGEREINPAWKNRRIIISSCRFSLPPNDYEVNECKKHPFSAKSLIFIRRHHHEKNYKGNGELYNLFADSSCSDCSNLCANKAKQWLR